MINKSILLFTARKNFNETEFLMVKKELEKAGFRLFIASDAVYFCEGNNGMKVRNDVSLLNINYRNFAAFVIIGGSGIKEYLDNDNLLRAVRDFYENDKITAALCAAPLVLAAAGILREKSAVCWFEERDELVRQRVEVKDVPVYRDGNIITGDGPGSALEFSHLIINTLKQ